MAGDGAASGTSGTAGASGSGGSAGSTDAGEGGMGAGVGGTGGEAGEGGAGGVSAAAGVGGGDGPGREERIDGVDDDGNGLVDDTANVLELLTGAVRYALEARDPVSFLSYDHLPIYDPDGPGSMASAGPDAAAWVFPQLAQRRAWVFPDEGVLTSFVCGDTGGLGEVFFRIEAELTAARTFAGAVWPASVDLRRWDRLTLRYRLNQPGAFELKLKVLDAQDNPIEVGTPLLYSGDDWAEIVEVPLASLFPGSDLARVVDIVFGFDDTQVSTGPVRLDIARLEFHPTPSRRTDPGVRCVEPYVDLGCREPQTGADKVAFALLLVAAADQLGIDFDGRDLRSELWRMLEGLARVPRWNGQAAGEPYGASGLTPNWFGVASGVPSPHDKHLSLTDSADLVAAMMVLAAAYRTVEPALAEVAAAEAAAMLPAASAILAPSACPSGVAYGAFLPASDDTGAPAGHQCTWIHYLRQNDTLLGTFLGFVSGALSPEYWVTGLNGCPSGATAECLGGTCGSDGRCASGGCAVEGYATDDCSTGACWYDNGGPAGACSCSADTPPGMDAGGLFLAYKALLFLHGGADPTLTSPTLALPVGFQSLAASAKNLSQAQIDFARDRALPFWGWSNAASPEPDGGYLGGCCVTRDIVTPHAGVLAISDHPHEVAALIDAYRDTGMFEPYVTAAAECAAQHAWGARDTLHLVENGDVRFRDHWLMLDQGLLGLTLVNHMTGGWLRERFDEGGGRSGYEVLNGHVGCQVL